MDMGIQGRIAIVGGASKGLGRASAEALAREGVNLTICSRDGEALEKTAREIQASTGATVHAHPGDLSQPETINSIVEDTVNRYGRLDILVSNIGGPPPATALSVGEEEWAIAVPRTYLFFARMARAALPHMQEQRWGRVISILSTSIKEPARNLILSTSARLGAAGFLKALSHEVAEFNITVNNVLPGPILTERQYELAQAEVQRTGSSLEDVLDRNARANPMRRIGKPEELGALVAFLASEHAAYISGANVPVDGGASRSIL